MATTNCGGVVLVIESDEAIRRMLSVVLQREGFRVRTAASAETAGALARADVIVRDVSLTPAARRESLRQLAAVPAEVRRRTIVATTGRACDGMDVFAVLRKPFDIDELVRTVIACAKRTREERLVSSPSLASLQRFVSSVPSLRRILTAAQPSPRELLLRVEMRRAMAELSEVLQEASRAERDRARAAAFRAGAMVAADLARVPVAATPMRAGH